MKVRFAPSPTGSLHLGNALGAVINRRLGDVMLLRIDDTDALRTLPGGEEAIVEDLRWLGIGWDEGPIRQSERQDRYREVAVGLPRRFEGVTLLRDDGSATYHLASVVDDLDFGITHVIRGNDHRPNEELHRKLSLAIAGTAPEVIHYGLVLGPDGRKLSKRAEGGSIASLREEGIPPEAVRAYLEELGVPRHDVRLDLARLRSLAVEAIAALPDRELAERIGVPPEVVPALRGARNLLEARELARSILEAPAVELSGDRETLTSLAELRASAPELLEEAGARELVQELRARGGKLQAVRMALTGHESGPELWAVLVALPRTEALQRIDAAL